MKRAPEVVGLSQLAPIHYYASLSSRLKPPDCILIQNLAVLPEYTLVRFQDVSCCRNDGMATKLFHVAFLTRPGASQTSYMDSAMISLLVLSEVQLSCRVLRISHTVAYLTSHDPRQKWINKT